jgi:outer membrane protein assembly factor BamA
MKRAFFLLSAGVILFCAVLPAVAQKFQPKNILFKGDPEYSDQELLIAAGLKKGEVLNYAEMKDHSQKLMDTGAFDTLSFKFDGQDLIYTLVPSAVLFPVRLENLPLTPGPELDAALHERFPLYHGKVPAEGGLVDGVRATLEEMLTAKGVKATVLAMPYTDQKLHKVTAVSFAITAPPVRVGAIHMEGVSVAMEGKVKRGLEHQSGAAFDTENSASNVEQVLATAYADEGYATAKVHAIRRGDAMVTAEAIQVPFAVSVEEGRQYKLGAIHLPSGELLSMTEINKAAGLASNKVETQSLKGGVTLRTALLFVAQEYKSKGYMNCVVTPHSQYDETNGVVNYTLEVQAGQVYSMGKLIIENASDALRTAMLAAWKMPEGAAFSEKAILDYYYAQGNTPLGRTFASANCKYQLATNNETHIVDVTLRLERKP